MKRKILLTTVFIGFLITLGVYFWSGYVNTNQARINKIFDLTRKMRCAPEGEKQDVKADYIKKIEDYIKKIENLLVDYTVENDIKKTIKHFLYKTVGLQINEADIQESSDASQRGLSGNPLLFIPDKKGNLKLVIKIFHKPFDLAGHFIKEIAGFQITSTMKGEKFHLISIKAIGKCKIDGKEYGLLAISPAAGISLQGLLTKLFFMPKGSVERVNMLLVVKRAFEKLGAALAEFHNIRVQKNVPLHSAVMKRARRHFKSTIEQLKDGDYGVDSQDLQKYFDDLAGRMEKVKTTRSIVHGDANLGNYLYDQKTDTLSLVDYYALHRVADQEGNPIWHAAFDFMNVLDAITIGKEFGFSEQECAVARDAFIKGYGAVPTRLEQEFFALVCRLRLIRCFLMKEKKDSERFADEKTKVIFRFRLGEIKKSLLKFKEKGCVHD
ncbi:phosphotransferase family protein [Candidatus Dependentiae bacterium]